MGEAPLQIERDRPRGIGNKLGVVIFARDMPAEHAGGRNFTGNWPIECIGSGVNAGQASELRKLFEEKSFNCEVSSDGNPIYTSASHRRRALKLRGFCDKSSYY
jgi:hypothetical protein